MAALAEAGEESGFLPIQRWLAMRFPWHAYGAYSRSSCQLSNDSQAGRKAWLTYGTCLQKTSWMEALSLHQTSGVGRAQENPVGSRIRDEHLAAY